MGPFSFHVWQPFTYMFLHANFMHLFCNMFAVLMFAPAIEERWGGQKFLFYYLVCGVGAALIQELVWMMAGHGGWTIGASGAVFGVLLAFGWLFPEIKMFLLFIPIPIPSRFFVGLYAIFELLAGISDKASDNVAHFAHLGGMLFGALLIWYWRRTGRDGYDGEDLGSYLKQRFHAWRDRIRKLIRFEKNEQKQYSSYHYQAPIREDKNKERPQRSPEVERLLEKIRQGGYESLTQEEKDRLFKRS